MRAVAPTCTATLSTGLELDVQSAEVTLDAGQAPYGWVALVCAAPAAADAATIDPRLRQRLTVTLDDHAADFGGTGTSRTLSLVLAARLLDPFAGTLTLTGMTDEAVLINSALFANAAKQWPASTVQQLVYQVLFKLGYAGCYFEAPDYHVEPDAVVQAPGQSYWDFLDGTLQGGNLRLWADEAGAFHLSDKSTVQPGQLSLTYGVDITGQYTDNIDLTAGEYMEALVVRFSWTDAFGNPQEAFDYASNVETARSVGLIEFPTAPGLTGVARRLLRRMSGRGRVIQQDAVARFDAVPGQSFVITPPAGEAVQSGLLQAVTWRYPDTVMSVTSRELSDTLPTMWAAQAAGVTWASIPAGVDWTEYLAISWGSRPAGESWNSEPAGVRWSEYANT